MPLASMSSAERVMRALRFQPADRAPRYIECWQEYEAAWRRQRPSAAAPDVSIRKYYGSDMLIVAADETPWPSRAGHLSRNGDLITRRDGWGRVIESQPGAFFTRTLAPGVPERIDPDRLVFDDPLREERYRIPLLDGLPDGRRRSTEAALAEAKADFAVFCKTGGPFLRAAFMRGEEQFLIDIAEDPEWTRAFVERVTDHLTAVGVESIRRLGLRDTGIEIADDVSSTAAPLMGRPAYERIFYPSLCKMVAAYKRAGAAIVYHHCDGRVAELLDLWLAAGIDAVNPLEARARQDPQAIRRQFPRLAIIGGLDNCEILPRGDREEIRRHLERLLDLARPGGFVIAPHSIGPDISLETMEFVKDTLDRAS